MNALNLPAGVLLNLQVLDDRSGHRIQVKVLGYKAGESLIAEVPGAALLPIDLRLGDEVAARCLVGRHFVMGFVYEQLSVARGVTHPAATARSGCAISAGSSTPGRRALQSERQR